MLAADTSRKEKVFDNIITCRRTNDSNPWERWFTASQTFQDKATLHQLSKSQAGWICTTEVRHARSICPHVPNRSRLFRMKRSLAVSIALLLCLSTGFAQDWAKQKLEKSSRHQEWVQIKHDNRTVQAFVVYPETKAKAPVIIVIHEIFGLTDWARSVADQLAANGYIAIAPDLLSGMGPKGGGSSEFSSQEVGKAISSLNPDQITADLNATADYAKKIPAGNGKIAVSGFCWGGGQSFRFATNRKDLSAAFVFYGPGPADVSAITAPVYGFYAGEDARIGATVPATTEAMKKAGKKYDPVTYEGAGHGFMRAGEDPANDAAAANNDPAAKQKHDMAVANKKAHDEGWQRWLQLLKSM
jgi:carboxymethylenebutenolidase